MPAHLPLVVRCLLLLIFVAPAAGAPDVVPQFFRLASPAGPGSVAPHLVTGADGVVWMSWLEPGEDGSTRLLCSSLDGTRSRWSEPRLIASGQDWFINGADTPHLASAGRGRLAAVWFVNHAASSGHDQGHRGYQAWTSTSTDGGVTWSPPAPLSQESVHTEFVALAPVAGEDWLAVWLDGRARAAGGAMQLYSRLLGRSEPDEQLDERVCDCCSIALATLPDGSAYTIYRDRSEDEVRDLAGLRWRDGHWSRARHLPSDGWKIEGCPVNGAALGRWGSRLGLVWFTAAGDQPRIQASFSTDFAVQWRQPQRLDRGAVPQGRVGAVLLRDQTLWATWQQVDGAVALTGVDEAGGSGETFLVPGLVPDHPLRAQGVTRVTLVGNAPGATPRLLIAATETPREADKPRVTTHLVTLPLPPTPPPPPAAPAAGTGTVDEDCGCQNRGPQEGHAVRGRIVRLLPEQESVLVAHDEVPGVMAAMTMAFRVDPRLLQFLQPEQEILARMARRDDGRWWMFNVRIVGARPAR